MLVLNNASLTPRLDHLPGAWQLFPSLSQRVSQAGSQPRRDQSQRGSLTEALCSLLQPVPPSASLPAAHGEPGGMLLTGSSGSRAAAWQVSVTSPSLSSARVSCQHHTGGDDAEIIPLPPIQSIFCTVFKQMQGDELASRMQSAYIISSVLGWTDIHPEASLYA